MRWPCGSTRSCRRTGSSSPATPPAPAAARRSTSVTSSAASTLRRPDSKTVLVIPASCWTIIAGIWPVNAFAVTVHLTPFASAAAEASAIKAALRLRGVENVNVVVWGGDGSTCDIGFSGVSAAAERNEDLIYILNDNEAYMNTGVQKSGATPEGAWTTTTPTRSPRAGQKKDIARIMAAHRVPYVATLAAGSVPLLRDFRTKVARAAEVRASGSCTFSVPARRAGGTRPPSRRRSRVWRSSRVTSRSSPSTAGRCGSRTGRSIRCRSGSSSRRRGASTTSRPTQVASIQAHVDERWDELVALEALGRPEPAELERHG